MASLVRPSMSTYLIAPAYSLGRNFVERVAVLVEVIVGVEGRVRQFPMNDLDVLAVDHGNPLSSYSQYNFTPRHGSTPDADLYPDGAANLELFQP